MNKNDRFLQDWVRTSKFKSFLSNKTTKTKKVLSIVPNTFRKVK